MTWEGMPCAGLPFHTPSKQTGKDVPGHQASGCTGRFGGQADGPLVGNGDVGAMLGGSKASNISLFLTKNDFWDLAQGQEPECRYGTYNSTLFVPKMEITDHCGLEHSLDRNSQGETAGLSIQIDPTKNNLTAPDANWSAVQHMVNGTAAGSYTLFDQSGRAAGTLHTESFVVAPVNDLTANISLVFTRISYSGIGDIILQVGTHGGGIQSGGCVGACPEPGGRFAPERKGANETWGSWVTTTEAAPSEGLRKGKKIQVPALRITSYLAQNPWKSSCNRA